MGEDTDLWRGYTSIADGTTHIIPWNRILTEKLRVTQVKIFPMFYGNHICNRMRTVCILSQVNTADNHPPYFLKIYF
jgi:hypothetical protein